MHTLGHFDIYGCALALILLLMPAGSLLFVALAALFSIVLVLIHHIHLLMYVPTIITIVVIRHYLAYGSNRGNVAFGVIALAVVAALFFAAQFLGTMPIPEADFVAYLKTRMADPSRTDLLQFAYIWYQPLAKEISDTWGRLPHNILGVPVFALLIWLHTPLWRFFANLIGALASETHRRLVIAALIGISLAYLVMFAMVFDYSRWISNWAVCMLLILHAMKMLPAKQETPMIPAEDRKTNIFGLIVTLIPRVGIVRPF
ncbi:multisubunit Na+/H+ antiporter MnhE subunit [Bradyrhizobium sp. USDA 377]